jgi:pimeloyl-ACP methyl ester carboxylesterase
VSSEEKTNSPQRKKRRLLILFAGLIAMIIALQYISGYFSEKEKTIRREFREKVREVFPEQAAKVSHSFGIRRFEAPDGLPHKQQEPARHVVLVHGLDDPGKVWMNLAPALYEEGYIVLIMQYPNDQPIVDSSRLFFTELKMLTDKGITEIVIVAHSMGGLVSREMLTSPEMDYARQMQSGRILRIIGLIMVGTPNHGSEIARFRIMGELRDQYAHFARGEGHWLRAILDGAGEAKIDLLPGSRFLTELNSRPQPEGVEMLVIAGVAAPWSDKDIDTLIGSLQTGKPASDQNKLDDLRAALRSTRSTLGDGLVTVDSALLPGVPNQTVNGTHLSIIRNITEGSDRIPPAIPIIIKELRQYDLSPPGK